MSEEIPQPESAPVEVAPPQGEPAVVHDSGDHITKSMEATYDRVQRVPNEGALYSQDREAAQANEQPKAPPVAKPQAWGERIAAHWDSLPEEIKGELAKRESDIQKFITQRGQIIKQAQEATQQFDTVLSRHADALPKMPDGSPMPAAQALDHLLNAHRMLESNPKQALQWLAQSYGVDPAELAPVDPQQEARQQYEAQQRAAQEQQVVNYVQQFAASVPNFDALESEILYHSTALRSMHPDAHPGAVLQEAYKRAVAAHPELDPQAQAKSQAQAAEAKRKADQAKRLASLNVRSVHSGGASPAKRATMEQTMREVADRMMGPGY